MSAAPEASGFLPGRPDDRHTATARALLEALRRRLPDAALAVAGSVGRGDYTEASDLDLVVTGAFQRDMSFALTYEGLGVAVLCVRSTPDAVPDPQIASAGVVDTNTPFVLNARAEDDPGGHLQRLRGTLGRVVEARAARADERGANLLRRAEGLLRELGTMEDELRAGPVRLDLFQALLDAWCLRHGVVLDEKAKYVRVFATLAERDPAFHALVAGALPLRPDSLPALARAAARLRAGQTAG
ncbi:MAG TPA: nucleotidyltransferase domain-containing protein [Longimicrobium sp.]|nr:nucleotidyltransferase domain-containing protein [Longimicrobium sp.]